MTYRELQEALRIFGLSENVTLKEIKARHRALVKCHHPDTGSAGDEEKMRQINAAHRVIQEYVSNYRYAFSEAGFYEQNPTERLKQQFAHDPIWAGEKKG